MTEQLNLAASKIGDNVTITYTCKLEGVAQDLTDNVVTFKAWDETAEIVKTIGSGITILEQSGATLGQAKIEILPQDTKQWTESTLINYEIQRVDATGRVSTPFEGTWYLKAEGITDDDVGPIPDPVDALLSHVSVLHLRSVADADVPTPGSGSYLSHSTESATPLVHFPSGYVGRVQLFNNAQGTFWVDETAGSDAALGDTEATALASLDEALRRIGHVVDIETTIRLKPAAAEGHVSTELWKPRAYRRSLAIIGEGVVEELAALAITGYASRVYTFAGTPFTAGALVGLDLEATGVGPTGIAAGQKRTIVYNTANTIVCSNRHVTPAFASPAAGDEFRVVRPAARISLRSQFSAFGERTRLTLHGSSLRAEMLGNFTKLDPVLQLRNLEFAQPDDQNQTQFVQFTGAFAAFGLHFTKNGPASLTAQFTDAMLFASQYSEDDIPVDQMGWGWSCRNRGAGALPELRFVKTTMSISGVFGQTRMQAGCWGVLSAACKFDGTDRGTGFPHGALHVGASAYLTTSSGGQVYFAATGERDIEVDDGWFDCYQVCHHLTNGGFVRSRHGGQFNLAATPAVVGTGMQIVAAQGGQIRILNITGTTLGEASVPGGITRAANLAWATGDHIHQVYDGSRIYRS